LVCLNTVVNVGRPSMHGWLRRSRMVSLVRLRRYARGCHLVGLGWLRRGSLTSASRSVCRRWLVEFSWLRRGLSSSAGRAGSASPRFVVVDWPSWVGFFEVRRLVRWAMAAAMAGGLRIFYSSKVFELLTNRR